jgi:hypothetical protein
MPRDTPPLTVNRPPGWKPSPALVSLFATLLRRIRDRQAARDQQREAQQQTEPGAAGGRRAS